MSLDTEGVPPSAPRRSRWFNVLLTLSLAANLLVLGAVATHFARHRFDGGHREHGLMGFVRQIPDERRASVEEYVRSEREKIAPLREEIRKAWADSNAALGEEPFDKEKMKGAMTRMLDTEARMRTTISDALVDTAAKLLPEDRQALKAWREGRRSRKGGSHRWWGGDDRH